VGIGQDGRKTILGLRQGATENAPVVGELLRELAERGFDFSATRLYVLDGGKALSAAVKTHAGERALIQRCQVHIAGRNPRLPEGWKVPSRASPCEPGSLGSGMAG
jgi:transposase-like protein